MVRLALVLRERLEDEDAVEEAVSAFRLLLISFKSGGEKNGGEVSKFIANSVPEIPSGNRPLMGFVKAVLRKREVEEESCRAL